MLMADFRFQISERHRGAFWSSNPDFRLQIAAPHKGKLLREISYSKEIADFRLQVLTMLNP